MQSSSRNGSRVRVLAVHTTEGIMRAVDLRAWTSWPGSSHASADETGVLLAGAADGFVDYERASWTLRSGNPWSENIELCGFARWTRAEWLARPKLIAACAKWLAARSKARGIPLVKLTPQQYRAGQSGVIGHHDHTIGYSDGTHWDPGPGFPWDVVLEQARDYAGGVDIKPTPKQEEPDMLIVVVNPKPGVYVPHVIAGDRYFALDSDATRAAMQKAGVPQITVGESAHRRFYESLRSEQATVVAADDQPPAA